MEVFGLYDYRIPISDKWIQLRLTNVLKNGTSIREIPMKEEYGLSMLLASGFLQGCAAKHESGR